MESNESKKEDEGFQKCPQKAEQEQSLKSQNWPAMKTA